MNNILVLYPKEFGSYDKFKRKLLQLTENMERFNLFYPSKIGDTNQFCKRFNYDVEKSILCNEIDDWKSSTITHVIIFDDGEEFVVEKLFFSSIEKPFRVIKIKITRVININRCTQYQGVKSTNDFEYIGRGSYWGNPHSMYDNNMDDDRDDRDEVIRKYKYDFDYDKFPNKKGYKDKSVELSGKKLGCFCKPYACHGDVIADYLNSLDDGL